jgi:hypothetical protein
MIAHSLLSEKHYIKRIENERELVGELGLTDLCLFTEARYTRHPSLTDIHSPFQDSPHSLEHFPSGSLMPPPQSLTDFYSLIRQSIKVQTF